MTLLTMTAIAMTALLHAWRFFRADGFDQPRIDIPADLLAIGSLDQILLYGIAFMAR